MWGAAGPGFSSQVQVDVQGGFSPSCCSTTPIHLWRPLILQLFFECVCHSCSNKCSPTLWLLDFFWVMRFFGSWIFWVLCFQGLRFHGYKSFSSGLLGLGNLRIATKVFGVKVSWSKAFGVQSFKVYGFRSLGFLGSIVFLGLKFLGSKV